MSGQSTSRVWSAALLMLLAATAAQAQHQVTFHEVDNTTVGTSSDPEAPDFNNGTYYTFDLVFEATSTEDDWSAAEVDAVIDGPGVFFQHPQGGDLPPDEGLFDQYPALEYDTYVAGAPGAAQLAFPPISGPTAISVAWFDTVDGGLGPYTIARFTVQWAGPAPVTLNIVGDYAVTSSAQLFDIGPFSVTILPPDLDGDGFVGLADLALLLSVYGSDGPVADINLDGVVDLSDLSILLASYVGGPDCNGNGIRDEFDIADGTSLDCNDNGVPDECDLADGTSPDCNGNSVPDECDVAGGASPDCNENGRPDECESGWGEDCNGNGQTDFCDIYEGISPDCDESGVPDECEPGGLEDCNGNGVPDLCDIHAGTSDDCNDDAIPDDCIWLQTDCNQNLIPDECDLVSGFSEDCNDNGIPDECDIASGSSGDCDDDGFPDECEIADGSFDCDFDGVPDECTGFENLIYVDDDAPNDPGPGDSTVSDPAEDGSADHPFDSVQEAIDSTDCGTVVIADGLYSGAGNYSIDMQGRLVIRSANGPQACTLRGSGGGYYILFKDEDRENPAFIEGLTLTGSAETAAYIRNGPRAPVTFRNCVFADNSAAVFGAGIWATFGPLTVENCLFSGNTADGGAAMAINGAQAAITGCTFVDNSDSDSLGGALYVQGSSVSVVNCIFWNNTAGGVLRHWRRNDGTLMVGFCDVEGGLSPGATDLGGNIDADPLFLDPGAGDYHISAGSPCIDAGDPAYEPHPDETDLDGDPRVIDGDNDGTAVIDLGADEVP
jgi:hypothetical protein